MKSVTAAALQCTSDWQYAGARHFRSQSERRAYAQPRDRHARQSYGLRSRDGVHHST